MKIPPLRLQAAWNLGGLTVRQLAIRTWKKNGDDEIMTRAAAVAFYAISALIPFLALIITLAVQLMPDLSGSKGGTAGLGNMTVGELRTTIKSVFPEEAYVIVEKEIVRLQTSPPVHLISIGLAITLWLASSLYAAIMDAMNRIYGVTETRPFWKLRLQAMFMTLLQSAVLLVSLVLIVAWPHLLQKLGLNAPAAIFATVVQCCGLYVMILLSFGLAFYFGPDAEQRWEWITPGSVLGTLIVMVASLLFRIYVEHWGNYSATYGSLGGVLVILAWLWACCLVLLTSAQINKVIEAASPTGKKYGQRAEPKLDLPIGSDALGSKP